MKASNKTSNAHTESAYKTLRLVPENSIQQTDDIFAGQTSPQAQRMRADIDRVAKRPFNILITGETGTGKTQMARQIHRLSARANKPFIELNCANLPEQLVEAELFGHRKGAFTGADQDRKGLFEEANGGVLFLDEIGDIPLTIQNRLLKAIDEKQIKRLGANCYQFCDVQIIAATSRDLIAMIQAGDFREDLYCRLAVLTVHACPLRERREDIPSMINRFLSEAAEAANQHHPFSIDEDALELFWAFDHPGNVRALRNLIYETTSYVEDNESISVSLLKLVLANFRARSSNQNSRSSAEGSKHAVQDFMDAIVREGDIVLPFELCVLRKGETFKQWTARAKRSSIEAATQVTGNGKDAAERLGLTWNSLKAHLKRARKHQSQGIFEWQNKSD